MTTDHVLEDCYYHAPDVNVTTLGRTVVVYVDACPAVVLSPQEARLLAGDLLGAAEQANAHTTLRRS